MQRLVYIKNTVVLMLCIAPLSGAELNSYYIGHSLTVDGMPNEAIWSYMDEANIDWEVSGNLRALKNPGSDYTTFKSCWNRQGVYFFFNIIDDQLNYNLSSPLLNRERIEINLNSDAPLESVPSMNISVEMDKGLIPVLKSSDKLNSPFLSKEIVARKLETVSGYQLEVFIPWICFRYQFIPSESSSLRMQVFLYDGDENEWSVFSWNPQKISGSDDSSYGILHFKVDAALSNNLIQKRNNFSMYPTLVRDLIYFSKDVRAMDIFDVTGRKRYTIDNIYRRYYDLSFLNKGIYFISVTDLSGERITRKILR